MLEALTLKDILDLGMQGILLVFVYALWQRLNTVTDRFFEDREAASAEREIIARLAGLEPAELHSEASYVLARRRAAEANPRMASTGQEETD